MLMRFRRWVPNLAALGARFTCALALTIACTDFSARAAATLDCGTTLHIPTSLLGEQIVIFGELHGTRETEAFVGDYVCLLASRTRPVALALEISESEQPLISSYLDSEGLPADVRALAAGEFWNRPADRQDGRSSKAMLALIERVRQLRQQHAQISIAAIDGQRDGLSRDGAMAQHVRELLRAKPKPRIVVLVGNVHALKEQGSHFDKAYQSVAFLLADLKPLTLNVQPKRGSAWVCIPACGVTELTPQAWIEAQVPGIYVGLGPDGDGRYHGTVVLDQAEASPPVHAP